MPITAAEQYLIELINRARLDPQAEADRNVDLAGDINRFNTGTDLGNHSRAPLAMNNALSNAAADHSQHMIAVDAFAHSGIGDGNPQSRANDAGYDPTDNTPYVGENISRRGSSGNIDLDNAIDSHHNGLVKSFGHWNNMLRDNYREIGVGQEAGQYTSGGRTWNGSHLTEKFGSDFSSTFLTGVFYNDADENNFYGIGEAIGGQFISVAGRGDVAAAAGGYDITITGLSDWQTVSYANMNVSVQLQGVNVKLDIVNLSEVHTSTNIVVQSGVAEVHLLGREDLSVTGGNAAEYIYGNSGANTINGAGGTDVMAGGKGNDVYTVDHSSDKVIEKAGEGYDNVYSSVDYILDPDQEVESVILTENAVTLRGDNSDNQLFGNGLTNVIDGRGGTDYMLGLGGADIFQIGPENGAVDIIGDFSKAEGDRIAFAGFNAATTTVHQVSVVSFEVRDASNGLVQQFQLFDAYAAPTYSGGALIEGTDYYFG
ncbi:CAP domain-containing protein [Ahrensia sp. R2A130]|uniref:CAP domain-containing protein n=1 Tax=Ahrensia sp. R2A130 TaxID=744979 RepID=UPI0001E08C3D|nr:CAP domain-containing protein [Ahrensia sp. R2A130]EFL89547.1 hemolysin-type calcium-binding region [Ahrensia sp. R2A130]